MKSATAPAMAATNAMPSGLVLEEAPVNSIGVLVGLPGVTSVKLGFLTVLVPLLLPAPPVGTSVGFGTVVKPVLVLLGSGHAAPEQVRVVRWTLVLVDGIGVAMTEVRLLGVTCGTDEVALLAVPVGVEVGPSPPGHSGPEHSVTVVRVTEVVVEAEGTTTGVVAGPEGVEDGTTGMVTAVVVRTVVT